MGISNSVSVVMIMPLAGAYPHYYANLDTAFQKSNTNYVRSKHLISIWGLKAHLDLALKHWWVQYIYGLWS